MVSYKVSLISPLTLKSCLSCRASNQFFVFRRNEVCTGHLALLLGTIGNSFIPHEIITVVVWSIIYIYIYVM